MSDPYVFRATVIKIVDGDTVDVDVDLGWDISVVNFDHSDVVRHPLVSKIVKAYSEKKND
mgnify:CR=1 FL=1